MIPVKYTKLHSSATDPKYATEQSACFDLAACFGGVLKNGEPRDVIEGYSSTNVPIRNIAFPTNQQEKKTVSVLPGARIKIPTGLIFDIPPGFSIRIHPRSGLSLKKGLVIANLEGVIDADYVEETFVIVYNQSDETIEIQDGDKIAQAEIVPVHIAAFEGVKNTPKQKTSRTGGFGSTGV